MHEPIQAFRNLIIVLITFAIVMHGVVLDKLLPFLHQYTPLKPLFDNPMIGAAVVALLTGTSLYTLIVVAPTKLYLGGGWKLWFPKLNFSGAWVAEIHDQVQICAPFGAKDKPLPPTSYLTIVEIEQTPFHINIRGFSEKRSTFSSSIVGISDDGGLHLVYVHRRLVSGGDASATNTEGVDHLTVADRTWLGKPKQLNGIWQMCAIPNIRLFRGHSKYVRITKKERTYLREKLAANPSFSLSEFVNWKGKSR